MKIPDYPPPPEARCKRGQKPINPWEPHNHRCRKCGLIWHHDPVQLLPEPHQGTPAQLRRANEAFKRSHTCPTCGTEQHYIDQTGTPAQCIFDGTGEPVILNGQPKHKDSPETKFKRWLFAQNYGE